jgi:hypothetical protein
LVIRHMLCGVFWGEMAVASAGLGATGGEGGEVR